MKRVLAAVAVLISVVPCLLWGQASPRKAAPAKSVTVEQQLIKLEQEWVNAYVTHDIQTLGRIEADDYIYTAPDGTVLTKAQDLEEVKSGVFVATSMVADDIKVRVYGDTAVVTGRNTTKAQYKGRDDSGQSRWTDTWIKRGGVWRCVATQSSKIAAAPADEAAIRQEVGEILKGYIAACERVDSAAALRFVADVPEFRYSDSDGKQYDFAGFTKLVTDLFAGLSAQKATTRNQEIRVLGPDTALVIWHGAADVVQKDGPALHSDDYNIMFLFKRFGATWKVVAQHDSSLPPAPSDSVAVEHELIKLELAWAAASVKRDLAALERLFADEATFGTADGKWQNKTQYLDDYRSGGFVSTSELHDGVRARLYGDVAVVTGRTTMNARSQGTDASGKYLWTDTWVNRAGRWSCVATHVSKVAQK